MQRWAEIKESQCTDFYPIGIGGLGYHIGIGLSERDWDIREGLGYQRGIGDIREGLGYQRGIGISERDWDIREGLGELGYQRGFGISERDLDIREGWGDWDRSRGFGCFLLNFRFVAMCEYWIKWGLKGVWGHKVF